MFTTNPYGSYEIYFNSTVNKRGVGILIKKCSPFTVLAEKRDCEENILILRVRHTASGKEFLDRQYLQYGPNKYEPRFFLSLRELLAHAASREVTETALLVMNLPGTIRI
jgi:hypothetical protein